MKSSCLEYLGTHDGVQRFRTTRQIVYPICQNCNIVVPAGFPTDLASIPKGLRWLVPKFGPWDEAAVLHDYLCVTNRCSRFITDAFFREAMAVLEVPVWRRVTMYYACRFYAVSARKH